MSKPRPNLALPRPLPPQPRPMTNLAGPFVVESSDDRDPAYMLMTLEEMIDAVREAP